MRARAYRNIPLQEARNREFMALGDDPLAAMLAPALKGVPPEATRVMDRLTWVRGTTRSPDAFAKAIGLRNRHQLRRLLNAHGLPCFEVLAGWVKVLAWLIYADTGMSLCRYALELEKDPSPYYRRVKRLSGRNWNQVLDAGYPWLVERITEILAPARSPRETSASVTPAATPSDARPAGAHAGGRPTARHAVPG